MFVFDVCLNKRLIPLDQSEIQNRKIFVSGICNTFPFHALLVKYCSIISPITLEFVTKIKGFYKTVATYLLLPRRMGNILCPRQTLLFVVGASGIFRKSIFQIISKIFQGFWIKNIFFKKFCISGLVVLLFVPLFAPNGVFIDLPIEIQFCS